jgi:hypothetical protein
MVKKFFLARVLALMSAHPQEVRVAGTDTTAWPSKALSEKSPRGLDFAWAVDRICGHWPLDSRVPGIVSRRR